MDERLRRFVRERASNRCEYCGLPQIVGRTAIGRATVALLKMNAENRRRLRQP